MNISIISPPSVTDDTEQAPAQPPSKRRFDERGIALQTIIIVVLLAIAGGVAAALLSRGQQSTAQLEGTSSAVPAKDYTTESFCTNAGFNWAGGTTPNEACKYRDAAACNADLLGDETPFCDGASDFVENGGRTRLGEAGAGRAGQQVAALEAIHLAVDCHLMLVQLAHLTL